MEELNTIASLADTISSIGLLIALIFWMYKGLLVPKPMHDTMLEMQNQAEARRDELQNDIIALKEAQIVELKAEKEKREAEFASTLRLVESYQMVQDNLLVALTGKGTSHDSDTTD